MSSGGSGESVIVGAAGATSRNYDRGSRSMTVDGTLVLTIDARDESGARRAIAAGSYTWTTSDAAVATVGAGPDDYSKVVTGVAVGVATISVAGPAGRTESFTVVVKLAAESTDRAGEIGLRVA